VFTLNLLLIKQAYLKIEEKYSWSFSCQVIVWIHRGTQLFASYGFVGNLRPTSLGQSIQTQLSNIILPLYKPPQIFP